MTKSQRLAGVLTEVADFLESGKGDERHGGVDGGDWEEITDVNGSGFLTGQAHKKFLEGMKMTGPAKRREMIGAVGYLLLFLINDNGGERTRRDVT